PHAPGARSDDLRQPVRWERERSMIDNSSGRILRQLKALRRENRRRDAFHSMLAATVRMLWRLEEMNRDGVKTVPKPVRAEIRHLSTIIPLELGEPLRDAGQVQDTLDS